MLRSDLVIFVDFVDCVDSVDTDWLLLLPLPAPQLLPRGSRPGAEALSSSMRSDDTGCIGEQEAGADRERDDVLSDMYVTTDPFSSTSSALSLRWRKVRSSSFA
jgi:hypothetical protein